MRSDGALIDTLIVGANVLSDAGLDLQQLLPQRDIDR
jgi:hypothetical protein